MKGRAAQEENDVDARNAEGQAKRLFDQPDRRVFEHHGDAETV